MLTRFMADASSLTVEGLSLEGAVPAEQSANGNGRHFIETPYKIKEKEEPTGKSMVTATITC